VLWARDMRDLGPRRDYDILVDGAKSGLFGLDLSLCEFKEEHGGYAVIELDAGDYDETIGLRRICLPVST